MTEPAPHDPYAVWRYAGYRRYLIGTFAAAFGGQMTAVAVSWQVYQWTGSATALGLLGLINVLPLLVLSLPAGMLADHADRRKVVGASTAGMAVLSLALAAVSYWQESIPPLSWLITANRWLAAIAGVFEREVDPATLDFSQPALPLLFLLLFLMAVLRIGGMSSRSALVPLLIPANRLSSAVTWNSSAFEVATMAGPALGGFLIAWTGFPLIYVINAATALLLVVLLFGVHYAEDPPPPSAPPSLRGMVAGAEFIWSRKRILAASTLDLFAVLLGGVTVLLPIYADRILNVGPVGLGWLRAAPCFGAFAMATWMAHRRTFQNPGVVLLWAVAGFGLAIVVFGLSTWLWLSLLALFATGVFDNVSVIVRQSLVQLLTPNHLRGRVVSVNQIFIGSSNEVGAMRAGLMAALIGPVAAVTWGGIGTILVVVLVLKMVPQLRTTPPLDRLRPE